MTFFGPDLRNGLPIGLGSVAGFGTTPRPFSPLSLFTGGVNGAWYDPSDSTTLFSDRAGTTPCAAPGAGALVPVGLMLDKSQGLVLGSELVTNGDFSSGTTGWSAPGGQTLSVENGAGKALNASTGAYLGTSVSVVTGTWYKFTYTAISDGISKSVGFNLGSFVGTGTYISSVGGPYAFGTRSVYWCATVTGTVYPWFFAGSQTGSNYILIDNVSAQALPGNHAIAANDTTARPELSARVNIFERTEEFDNAYWGKFNVTVSQNAGVAPNGTTTADKIIPSASNSQKSIYKSNIVGAGTYTTIISAKADGYNTIQLYLFTGAGFAGTATARLDLGTVVIAGNGSPSGSIANLGNSWYLVALTATVPSTAEWGCYVGNNGSVADFVGDGTSGVLYWGADLRVANIGTTIPAYQRVADQYTYDTVGFPRYLAFNGTDSAMSTPANVNLSSTDKATVFAGVRKNDNTNVNQLVELSADVTFNAGSFSMPTNDSGAGRWATYLRGSAGFASASATGTTAPITTVNTGLYDIALSADEVKLRINGAQVATSGASDAGTGSFGTYPLYIGSRGNASLRFTGHIYSIIVAGSAVSAGNITATEQWVAGKTGITI